MHIHHSFQPFYVVEANIIINVFNYLEPFAADDKETDITVKMVESFYLYLQTNCMKIDALCRTHLSKIVARCDLLNSTDPNQPKLSEKHANVLEGLRETISIQEVTHGMFDYVIEEMRVLPLYNMVQVKFFGILKGIRELLIQDKPKFNPRDSIQVPMKKLLYRMLKIHKNLNEGVLSPQDGFAATKAIFIRTHTYLTGNRISFGKYERFIQRIILGLQQNHNVPDWINAIIKFKNARIKLEATKLVTLYQDLVHYAVESLDVIIYKRKTGHDSTCTRQKFINTRRELEKIKRAVDSTAEDSWPTLIDNMKTYAHNDIEDLKNCKCHTDLYAFWIIDIEFIFDMPHEKVLVMLREFANETHLFNETVDFGNLYGPDHHDEYCNACNEQPIIELVNFFESKGAEISAYKNEKSKETRERQMKKLIEQLRIQTEKTEDDIRKCDVSWITSDLFSFTLQFNAELHIVIAALIELADSIEESEQKRQHSRNNSSPYTIESNDNLLEHSRAHSSRGQHDAIRSNDNLLGNSNINSTNEQPHPIINDHSLKHGDIKTGDSTRKLLKKKSSKHTSEKFDDDGTSGCRCIVL